MATGILGERMGIFHGGVGVASSPGLWHSGHHWQKETCLLQVSLLSIPRPDCTPFVRDICCGPLHICISLSVGWLLSSIFKFFEDSLYALGHFQFAVRWQFWYGWFRAHLGCRNLLIRFLPQGLGSWVQVFLGERRIQGFLFCFLADVTPQSPHSFHVPDFKLHLRAHTCH